MYLTREGKQVQPEAIEVSNTANIKTVYVARLIRDEGIHKTVVAEEKFDKPITKQQLLYCLAKYPQASFAVKEKTYVLVDDALPFN